MGTRSLTRIIPRQDGLSFAEGHEKGELAYVSMYRHFDGYPSGHGIDLAEFLKDFVHLYHNLNSKLHIYQHITLKKL